MAEPRPQNGQQDAVAINVENDAGVVAAAGGKCVDASEAVPPHLDVKGLVLLEPASTMAPGNFRGGDNAAFEALQRETGASVAVTNAKQHSPTVAAPSVPLDGPAQSGKGGGNSWLTRAWRRVLTSMRAYKANVKKQPLLMLGPPLLLFAVCVALGVYGVVAGAQKEASDKRTVVEGAGLDWAASFKLTLEQTFAPLTALSIFVRQNSNYTELAPRFPSLASQLLAQLPPKSIQELQLSPMGVIKSIYPDANNTLGRKGADIFAEPALRGGAIATLQLGALMLNGPLWLVNGGNFAAIVRLPIYILNSTLNETFGTDRSMPTNCPPGLCWDPVTNTKLWGFVTAILPMDDLLAGNDTRLAKLKQNAYRFQLTRPYTSTEVNPNNETFYSFANSTTLPTDPVSVDITISNAVWTLYLEPDSGWTPSWEAGMIVLVVLGSTVLAVLVAVIMASWAQQKRLLNEVMESNAALAATTRNLEEEKLRLDALLVRQYNLLSVLGGADARLGGGGGKGVGGGKGDGDSPTGGSMASKEGLTLERIELMRRQLAVNTNSSAADMESIQTLELLGEGTFGKVYKGLWRGTVVAVKTMVLPANMSGTEKREKMAVMEAAISSSLSHPNIVQTYTYAIRPVRDTTGPVGGPAGDDVAGSNLLIGNSGVPSPHGSIKSSLGVGVRDSSASANSVHSYEVRLVLEYCDKGCLRDALDEGAFMADQGLNYTAVLEVAADVAKAMLHLHSLNVLHGDLKARNVLLKGEGSASSSVIAKVADFGLSLKMDHMETHISAVFQGTMTHMAPEILLEGRVSKAADVYAFGITLWELFTAGHAFQGVPRALLGHQISKEVLRPRFPKVTPQGFRDLAERCWHPNANKRPTFEEALTTLLKLRAAEPSDTPAVRITARLSTSRALSSAGQHALAAAGACAPSPALPPASGISPLAPAPGQEGEEGDMWGGIGRTVTTVVRQRPLTLPKIQEGKEQSSEEQERSQQLRLLQQQQAAAAAGHAPTPAPAAAAAALQHAQGRQYGQGAGGGGARGHIAPPIDASFPSAIQVMDLGSSSAAL